jgi:hypothetical protein
MQHDQ